MKHQGRALELKIVEKIRKDERNNAQRSMVRLCFAQLMALGVAK